MAGIVVVDIRGVTHFYLFHLLPLFTKKSLNTQKWGLCAFWYFSMACGMCFDQNKVYLNVLTNFKKWSFIPIYSIYSNLYHLFHKCQKCVTPRAFYTKKIFCTQGQPSFCTQKWVFCTPKVRLVHIKIILVHKKSNLY